MFHLILKRYKCFIPVINFEFLDELLVKNVMLRAYESHSNIDFKIFVKNCIKNPVEYLYQLSEQLEFDYYDLHLLNNCFNDKSAVH